MYPIENATCTQFNYEFCMYSGISPYNGNFMRCFMLAPKKLFLQDFVGFTGSKFEALASKQNMLCNIFLGEIYFPKPIQPSNFCPTDCYTEYE